MPVFESQCGACGAVKEWFAHNREKSDPICCGKPMTRLASAFNMPFVGLITAKYNDKSREGAHLEGQWVTRRESTRRPDGKPEQVFLSTFAEQAEYCKAEGLVNPRDSSPNIQISQDGRSVTRKGNLAEV